MAQADYSKLTDREIELLIAIGLMDEPVPTVSADMDAYTPSEIGCWRKGTTGYQHGDVPIWIPKPFARDDSAARLVRNRIAELGLIYPYMDNVDTLLFPASRAKTYYDGVFAIQNATPRQQAEAALRALEGRQK